MSELEDKLAERLREDEGLSLKPYKDTKGILTIGYGHNLDANGIDKATAEFMLMKDMRIALDQARDRIEDFDNLSVNRKIVIASMIFQMGMKGLLGFKEMLKAMHRGEWNRAAHEMRDSEWWRVTCHDRAERLAKMMEQG